jgi:thioredoxin reductase (NADPH)
VGLYQVFALGLQSIRCHVVDALPHTGGQCAELYPDKPIFDIPGIPRCSGIELVHNLEKQIAPFKAQFHMDQVVTDVARQPDQRLLVSTSRSTTFLTRTLFIAAGVGAFLPRRLKIEGLDGLQEQQVVYQAPEPATCSEKHIVITGEGDAVLQCAIALSEQRNAAALPRVTVVHRRDVFHAEHATLEKFRELQTSGALHVHIGQITGVQANNGLLQEVFVTNPSGTRDALCANQLVVLQGLSPKLGPVAHWGLALDRKQLTVNTEDFSTSETGIFAIGDINTYPGKRKLIVCGFHEATLAAFGAAAIIFPTQPVRLQYTTTSSKLHTALGYTPDTTCENSQNERIP